jgi:hypothetical protein
MTNFNLTEPIQVNLYKPGEWVQIDPEDQAFLEEANWRWDKDGYVVRGKRVNGTYKMLRFHREVLKYHGYELTNKNKVDHIDGVRNHNNKANLRICSHTENSANRRSTRGGSAYKKVSWDKRRGGWQARVTTAGRSLYIGTFPSEREAAYFYNQAARQIHGEYAQLNEL